ncbi:MAG TPA: glycosyltransferase family 4 protein [Acidimicrobiia bacterium]|nr:glycosyltransferase family 4 protein [Acidimicrobiia bacterium]
MARAFVIAPNLPYPTRSGADLRTTSVLKALGEEGAVAVFGIGRTRIERPPISNLHAWETTSAAAVLAHDQSLPDSRWISEPDWVPSDRYFSKAIANEIFEVMSDFRPEIVVLEQLVTAGYLEIAETSGGKVILDAHNVESHLHAEMAQAERGVRRMVRKHFAERVELLESRVVKAVDRVWACSESDRALFLAMDSVPVDVVPNGIEPSRYEGVRSRRNQPESPPVLLFPANFGYEPNVRAAEFLARELVPVVSSRWPGSQFLLPGRDPQPDLIELARSVGIEMPGAVDDILGFFERATAMVVPLFEGGGTRLKVLEAFASELPVIATAKAVEGLDLEEGIHYLRAEEPRDYVEALDALMAGSSTMTKTARMLVEDKYSQRAVDRSVGDSLETLEAA